MRRVLFSIFAVLAFAAVGPATAVAKHHGKKHHRTHHPRVRIVGFGRSDTSTAPAPLTATGHNAGTVVSFAPATPTAAAVLVIKLNDGTTVSGIVTQDTELQCEAASMTTGTVTSGDFRPNDGSGGGDNGGSRGGDNQGAGGGDQSGDTQQSGDNQQGDDAQQDNNQQGDDNQQTCLPNALKAGAVVHEAELRISSVGSVWDKLDLLQ